MLHKYLEIASTPAVKAARSRYGSAAQYARIDGTLDPQGAPRNDRIGPDEAAFIAARDGFYLASVSETGPMSSSAGDLRVSCGSSTTRRWASPISAAIGSTSPPATSPAMTASHSS